LICQIEQKATEMRELTMLETGYLIGGLLLCLVLPLLMSFRGSPDTATRRLCMKTVWMGQASLTFAGVVVLVLAPCAPFAAAHIREKQAT
jgi:hypothetical protein